MTATHEHGHDEVRTVAGQILERLDLVEVQLATIRSWAELLIAKGHDTGRQADAGT